MSNINNNSGFVQISDDVLVTIVQTATMEVEGVSSIASSFAGEIMGKLGKKMNTKGIIIINDDNKLTININLGIKINYKIVDVAKLVQTKVKNAMETMTGLDVLKVNINVVSVDVLKDKVNDSKDKCEAN